MKFEEAIGWLKKGEKIRRKEWSQIYIYLKDQRVLMSGLSKKKCWAHSFNYKDVFADDWVIETRDNKYELINDY